MQTETNGEGKFAFDDLPPGTYTLTANAPGLEAEQIVTLGASQVVQVSLQLKPVKTTTTIDVAAADTAQKTRPQLKPSGKRRCVTLPMSTSD